MLGWVRRLLGGKSPAPRRIDMGGLVVAPASFSTDRAQAAMSGTDDLVPLLTLVPPPFDTDLAPSYDAERDYGPDPVAELSLTCPATDPFDCRSVARALSAALGEDMRGIAFYVVTPDRPITYLMSNESPPIGTALIIGWSYQGFGEKADAEIIRTGRIIAGVLADRTEGFTPASRIPP